MARSRAELTKGMQFGRPRLTEEPVPRLGPKSHDAGEIFAGLAKPDRTKQRGEVGAQGLHARDGVSAGVDRHDEKYRGARQRRRYLLTGRGQSASFCRRRHRTVLRCVAPKRSLGEGGSPPQMRQSAILVNAALSRTPHGRLEPLRIVPRRATGVTSSSPLAGAKANRLESLQP